MFCYQCEQTAKGKGCDTLGVCGKTPSVAALQDLLVNYLKGLSWLTLEVRKHDLTTAEIDLFICRGLFSTVTNVNFDESTLAVVIKKAAEYHSQLTTILTKKNISYTPAPIEIKAFTTVEEMIEAGKKAPTIDSKENSEDILSLKNTVLYALKGIAAYVDHAAILGYHDTTIYHFIEQALALMLRYDLSLEEWVGVAMETGKINLTTMELLDKAHHERYGHPIPTSVPLGAKKGKALLVSGHDLKDLELILEQTEGSGIYVYTHGEMLPTHGYPGLKKYEHFFGHYGTAWQNQHKEFTAFPGAIIMTTNCIQQPREGYSKNLFTTGLVEWPEITHIDESKDFSPAIKRALELPGFAEDTEKGSVMVGFAHKSVLGIADKIIDAVQEKKLRHFFLVAGCDGAKPGRNYYTSFVEQVPKDCAVLTLACGKFRFFDKQLGDIDGIPRLIDIGQCNDAYSAIKIAAALADAFKCDVNDLPLSFILSWYEQKAVAILLTLLSLGIKDIRLGPTLPAFITPNVLDFLVKTFDIKAITTPEEDLNAILGEKSATKA
jgi:hydroxylamine reductase